MTVFHRSELELECDGCRRNRVAARVVARGSALRVAELYSVAEAAGWRKARQQWLCDECRAGEIAELREREAFVESLIPADLDTFRRLVGSPTDVPFRWKTPRHIVGGREWLAFYWRSRGENWKSVGSRIPARDAGCNWNGRTLSAGAAAILFERGVLTLTIWGHWGDARREYSSEAEREVRAAIARAAAILWGEGA